MKNKTEASTIAKHISVFLNEYTPSQKSASLHTRKAYQDAIGLYLEFLETKGFKSDTLGAYCFEKEYLDEWISWLGKVRGNQPETRNNRLASMRTFLKYLGHKESRFLYLYQEASEIERCRVQKKKVKGMSRSAVKALLATPNLKIRGGIRDFVLILMLYSTAARIDEILSIKIGHLNLEGSKPYVNITGKGRKIRTLYLLPRTVAHLRKYLTEFHDSDPSPDAYLFYSRNEGPYGKLTSAAVDKMLKKHAKTAHEKCDEVPIKLHAHQLRHAKASHWLEDGMNIVQISYLLGHEQLQTTMVYLDITMEDEIKALETLEGDESTKSERKWKKKDGSLRDFCGLTRRKM